MADNPYERDTSPTPDRAADGAPSPAPHDQETGEPRRVEDGPGEDSAPPAQDRPAGQDPTDSTRIDADADAAAADPSDAPDGAATNEDATRPIASTQPGRPAAGDDAVTSTFDLRDRPGQHQAERPVPRSGLAEHRSAGYLTGELSPPEPAAAPARTAPAEESAATQTVPTTQEEPRTGPDRAVVLDGTTASPKLPSRAAAHVWSVVLTLLLTPVAWYLLADAGARLTQPAGNPWDTADLNIAALLELAGGLLVLAVVLLTARWSSLGAIVAGSLLVVAGVPFLAVPAWTQELLGPATDWLHTLGDFGGNVAAHLVATGSTGRLVGYGLALILVGVVSHGARRRGRQEMREALRA